jgi:hypothetical protein
MLSKSTILSACVVLLLGSQIRAINEPEEYVRTEVRGKLEKWNPSYFLPWCGWYSITVGKENEKQFFWIDLPDEGIQKRAKELEGQVVIALGDMDITEVGNGARNETRNKVHRIRVKSLKKADPIPEKKNQEGGAKSSPKKE